MYYPDKIKQFPITGLAGFGGGATGLVVAGGAVTPLFAGGDRGLMGGGRTGGGSSGATNRIDYINITSTSGGSDFGDLSQRREGGGDNITNGSRCCFAGGYSYSDSDNYDIIDYVTSSTTGNATDFGDLTTDQDSVSGCADANIGRGFCGPSYQDQDQLEYITIATTGNSSDFGTLTLNSHSSAATSNGIYGWWHGGRGGSSAGSDVIGYLVTATLGNASDWGDLHRGYYAYSCTNSIDAARIVQGGGYHGGPNTYGDWIDYYTTASAGNASDFGNLTVGRSGIATTGNSTRAVFMGGYEEGGPLVDTMDYITIASTGDASDFGDLGGDDRAWGLANSGAAS